MAKKMTERVTNKEAPLGIGPMSEKSSTELPSGGGSGGKPIPGGAPDGQATPDGAGAMNSQNMDAGSAPARSDIGATVPKSRHTKNPL